MEKLCTKTATKETERSNPPSHLDIEPLLRFCLPVLHELLNLNNHSLAQTVQCFHRARVAALLGLGALLGRRPPSAASCRELLTSRQGPDNKGPDSQSLAIMSIAEPPKTHSSAWTPMGSVHKRLKMKNTLAIPKRHPLPSIRRRLRSGTGAIAVQPTGK